MNTLHPDCRIKLLLRRACLGVALTRFVSITMATQPSLPGDWPTYGNGPAHTGYFPGKLNGLPWVQKWKTPMPHNVLSQPAIGGGRVYVSAGYYFSAMSVRALDANTGAGVWTNNLPGANSISPPA
jgi:hypothetical protein